MAATKQAPAAPAPIFKGAATTMERVRPGEEDGPRRTVGLRAITPASLAGLCATCGLPLADHLEPGKCPDAADRRQL